jgi:mono/diheme cytochrome c family protein
MKTDEPISTPPVSVSAGSQAPAAGPGSPFQLRPWQRTALFSLPVVLVAAGWGAPATVFYQYAPPDPTAAAESPAREADGGRLYAQNCAYCHGERGDGAGLAHLNPRARNFGEGKFRLATTANGVPTDDDLLFVLRHGIPGSAMPAFAHFGADDLRALAGHVRRLTRGGVYDRQRKLAEQEGGEPDFADLNVTTEKLTRPGEALAVPREFPPATPESLTRGRAVYVKSCASCHGQDGKGDGPDVANLKNMDGSPNRPRDLTLGRFKGGGAAAQVYARIRLGMPGSPMPATAVATVPEPEALDLVNYVLSLSRSGAGDATATGERTAAALPP